MSLTGPRTLEELKRDSGSRIRNEGDLVQYIDSGALKSFEFKVEEFPVLFHAQQHFSPFVATSTVVSSSSLLKAKPQTTTPVKKTTAVHKGFVSPYKTKQTSTTGTAAAGGGAASSSSSGECLHQLADDDSGFAELMDKLRQIKLKEEQIQVLESRLKAAQNTEKDGSLAELIKKWQKGARTALADVRQHPKTVSLAEAAASRYQYQQQEEGGEGEGRGNTGDGMKRMKVTGGKFFSSVAILQAMGIEPNAVGLREDYDDSEDE